MSIYDDNHLRGVQRLCRRLADEIDILDLQKENDPEGMHPRWTGQVRRTSMELTRALAQLRRPS